MNCLEKSDLDNGFELTSWDSELKGRRRLFVLYYCTDEYCFLNGTRAYKKAFSKMKDGELIEPSDLSAAQTASRLLQDSIVRRAINKLNRKSQDDDDEESARRLLDQYKTMVFFDISKIIDVNGRLKVDDLEKLGKYSNCVQGITVTPGKHGNKVEVKLVDRQRAMESFAKYLNLIRPESTNNVTIPVVVLPGKTPIQQEEDCFNFSS